MVFDITVIFELIKVSTPINGVNIRRPFLRTVIYKYLKEHVLARNPTNVINVIKPFHNTVICDSVEEHLPETTLGGKQCGKPVRVAVLRRKSHSAKKPVNAVIVVKLYVS